MRTSLRGSSEEQAGSIRKTTKGDRDMSPWAAEEVPRGTVPQFLAQDRQRSQHGVVLGRREVTGTFHAHFGRSPSAGVRSEQPAASWSSVKSPAVGWISRCAYPHPNPTPRSPSAPFTSSALADARQGCQTASRRGGAGLCPVLLFLELSLWDFNDSSATPQPTSSR